MEQSEQGGRLQWFVSMTPKPQQRHRHTRCGRTYDPCKEDKRVFSKQSFEKCPVKTLYEGPLQLFLVFYFARPKSHYKKNKHDLTKRAPPFHVARPDVDNCSKFVMDALNGTYYRDDSQICELHAKKSYCEPGDEGVSVLIQKILV